MKKIIILNVLLFISVIYIFSTGKIKNKYDVLVLPFINFKNFEKDDKISKLINEQLNKDFVQTEILNVFSDYADYSMIEKLNHEENSFNIVRKLSLICNEKKVKFIIFGNYVIEDNIIIIKAKIFSLIDNEIIDVIVYEGKTEKDLSKTIEDFVFITNNRFISYLRKNKFEEKKQTKEFLIGGGFSESLVLEYCSYQLVTNPYSDNESDYHDSSDYYYPTARSFSFIVPFSFIYFPSNVFGFGIDLSTGFNILFLKGYEIQFIDIITKIYFVNKLKNIYYKMCLIYEIGLILDFRFCLPFYGETIDLYIYNKLKQSLYLGPGIFVGVEKYFKSGFSTTIGIFFEAMFLLNPYYNEKYSLTADDPKLYNSNPAYDNYILASPDIHLVYSNYFLCYLKLGFEFRFQYKIIKQ